MMDEIMDEAFGMSSNEQTGWKKRKTPKLAITNEASTASPTPVAHTRSFQEHAKRSSGNSCSGTQTIDSFGRCGHHDGLGNSDNKAEGGSMTLWCKFCGCSPGQKLETKISSGVRNNKKKTRERLTRGHAQNKERPLGVSFHYSTKQPLPTRCLLRETQNCTLDGQKWDSRKCQMQPAVWDSVLGSFKPIHPKHKEDKPWTWVATIRSDAPSQLMEQFSGYDLTSHRWSDYDCS